MIPYSELLPIEQAIVDWKMAHPTLFLTVTLLIAIAGIIGMLYIMRTENAREQQRISRERAEKRAYIKANGGL